jgi:cysteine synthase A
VRTVSGPSSLIEGIGRPRCEPSFIPELIDRAYAVSDAESIAAARVLSRRIGRSCGGSTGTNLWAAARIIAEMETCGEQGSVATILCDSGERYRSTHLDDTWLEQHSIHTGSLEAAIERFFETGIFMQSAQTP